MRRKAVGEKILSMLEAALPDVEWSARVTGASRSGGACGSVTSDRISYNYDDKNSLIAEAVYMIYIVDVNSTEAVDEMADTAFTVLNDDDLDGLAISSRVKQVIYGSPQGKPTAGDGTS